MNENPLSILLIDDDPKLLSGIKFFLNRNGYSVQTAQNGQEALLALTKSTPDLILCDVMMPEMDGYQLRKRINQIPEINQIPFIFLTARSTPADVSHGLESGGDDYITKPFDRKELLARSNTLLRRVKNSQELSLTQLDQQIETFQHSVFNNASHELKTPLTWVLSGLELALNTEQPSLEELRPVLKNAMSGAQQLEFMLDDMIFLTYIDQNKLDLLRREVNLRHDFLQPIKKRINYYHSKQVFLKYEIDDNLSIIAPRDKFRHMVMHLVDNALKFSPEEGTITISLTSQGIGGCRLIITDQGPGIPVDLQEKVFDRYYQINQGDSRPYDGLGIGLTITRTIARALNGNVTFLPVSMGCRVLLDLPPSPMD